MEFQQENTSEKKKFPLYLGYLLSKNQKFYFCDIANKIAYTRTTSSPKNTGCYEIIVGETFYIIGGMRFGKRVLAFQIPFLNTVKKKQSMFESRYYSSSIELNSSYIFTIGGRSIGKALKQCEYYDIAKDKWTRMSSLCIARELASLVFYNSKFLYVFEGGNNLYVLTYEVFDVYDPENGWKMHFFTSEKRKSLGRMFISQYSCATFLIAGGRTNTEFGVNKKSVYEYSVLSTYAKLLPEVLPKAGEFSSNTIVQKGKIFQLESTDSKDNIDLYIYKLYLHSFSLIKFNSIWPSTIY